MNARTTKATTDTPRWVVVGGKSILLARYCTEFQTIHAPGWVQITSIGSENVYFNFKTEAGETLAGYCKCL